MEAISPAMDLASLINSHQAGVWRYLRVLGCSAAEADDLTQETFLAVWQRPFQQYSAAATSAYLRTVARNLFLTARRRGSKQVPLGELEELEAAWGRWAAVVLIGLGFLISLGSVAFSAMSSPSEFGASLAGAVVGSIIPAYVLYLLLSAKGTMVFSPEYKRIIAETPHVKYRTSCIVWGFLVVLLVILAIAVIGGVVSSINS